jgi:lipoprotein-anchoring transpeptidase ErfK/SrfK
MKLIYMLVILVFSISLYAEDDTQVTKVKELTREVIPLSKTMFQVINLKTGIDRVVDLQGKDFIIVSVREEGSDGRFYAVDKDGTVWWSGPITSGTAEYRSPSGIFHILRKERYYMSKAYPDENGINNMDYSMFFTKFGHALHKGNTNWMSRGCIHMDEKDISPIFKWATYGTKIVITRHSYMPFARSDLLRYYK